jgi:hypothetical protein
MRREVSGFSPKSVAYDGQDIDHSYDYEVPYESSLLNDESSLFSWECRAMMSAGELSTR